MWSRKFAMLVKETFEFQDLFTDATRSASVR
ncbi:hypothetical protein THAOC_08562, partial [Thalassiosira oceanica]